MSEQKLITRLLDPEIAEDPLAFVMYAFPWGEAGTPLEHMDGPREWQRGILTDVKEHLILQRNNVVQKKKLGVLMEAVSSGRGIGKSALLVWLALWFQSTRIGSTVFISANNEAQLRQVTWAELGKWHAMLICRHWFEMSATAMRPTKEFVGLVERQLKRGTGYYYVQAKLWSEENPDGYAGPHNPLGMMLMFDEASGIPPPIWTVAGGYFTEPVVDRYWFAFSNPRRNTGAFFECFHGARDFWKTRSVDSRDVEGTDGAVYERLIKQYGEDSDEVRVEVKGEFPRQGSNQFISREVITAASVREVVPDIGSALIMGVDVARFGSDASVIRFRQGRDARSIPAYRYKGIDNMQLAYRAAELIDKYKPDSVCIDAGGGTGVIDRLREMGYKVVEVWFGASSDEPEWKNTRTMMWGRMRDWLPGGCIDASKELMDDLAGPEYRFAPGGDAKMLETKDSMRARGLHSPDDGDALALTFKIRVSRKDSVTSRGHRRNLIATGMDIPVFT